MQKVEAIVKCCYCGYLIEKKEISVNFQSTHTRNCPNNACKKQIRIQIKGETVAVSPAK